MRKNIDIMNDYITSEVLHNMILNKSEIFVRDIMEQYNLQEDPFTKLPCSCKEYAKNSEEYDRQLMEERYGCYE